MVRLSGGDDAQPQTSQRIICFNSSLLFGRGPIGIGICARKSFYQSDSSMRAEVRGAQLTNFKQFLMSKTSWFE